MGLAYDLVLTVLSITLLSAVPSLACFLLDPTSHYKYSKHRWLMSASSADNANDVHPRYEPIDTEEREVPVWDPVAQIYVGGVVPENAEVKEMIQANKGCLRLFGYGSLCWNPGHGALAHPSVEKKLGRAKGYRRCWAQKSTDHRGLPSFPGIVCTLLKDEEVRRMRRLPYDEETLTEGIIFEVPSDLVEECLFELDFREKGGYARDIINVVEDETEETVQALLYRGTPENPAMWPRALRDLPFAAAIMSVAVGPSGENHVYLHQLDEFLETAAEPSSLEKFDDTFALAAMTKTLQEKVSLFFLFGSGSNQHNQLLLDGDKSDLANGEDAHQIKELILCTEKMEYIDPSIKVVAGGGHGGLLTASGRLFLWGWNDSGQLGSSGIAPSLSSELPLPVVSSLEGISVQEVSLGFSHTLVVERGTRRLFAFGENSRGQVNGIAGENVRTPMTPDFLKGVSVTSVSAGLFHSAVITADGRLITFGCENFGQCLQSDDADLSVGSWSPSDGSTLIQVECGRRHTIALDNQGRIWTFGENKYGQLGRQMVGGATHDATPGLVQLETSKTESSTTNTVLQIACGWSHNVVLTEDSRDKVSVYGWGRNDKGQLGNGSTEHVASPQKLFGSFKKEIKTISCGSESTIAVDQSQGIWGCGWNEHGNLATSYTLDSLELVKAKGAPITLTPGCPEDSDLSVACGGAHLLATRVAKH